MAETSFIPKTFAGEDLSKPKEYLGVFLVAGVVVFVIAVSSLVGLIFYKQYLSGQIEGMTKDLKRIEEDFKKSSIEEWARTAESMDLAKDVISKHGFLSNVFSFIEKNTLPDVRFNRFDYEAGKTVVILEAEAKSYEAMAQQREVFIENPAVSKIGIGNFKLDSAGRINFEISLTFNPSILAEKHD